MSRALHCIEALPKDVKLLDDKLFRIGLFAICDTLRGSITGAGEQVSEKEGDVYCLYLKYRIAKWDRSARTNKNWQDLYDEAVLSMLKATIQGYEERRTKE